MSEFSIVTKLKVSLSENFGKKACEASKLVGATLFTLWLTNFAFSRSSKNQIRQRAHRKSEVSRTPDFRYKKDYLRARPCEAAHINHDKRFSGYDRPENGLYLTDIEHWLFHLEFQDCPEAIGLSYSENVFFFFSLQDKIYKFNKENNVPMPEETKIQILSEGVEYLVKERCKWNQIPNPYYIREAIYLGQYAQEA